MVKITSRWSARCAASSVAGAHRQRFAAAGVPADDHQVPAAAADPVAARCRSAPITRCSA
ncbi:hypothetical protein M8494_27215 [Serratia ureilytica]